MVSYTFLLLLLIFFGLVIVSVINGIIQKHIACKSNGNKMFLDRSVTDTLRGIAILMIMLAHIVQQLGERLEFQFTGGKYIKLLVFSWGGVGVGIFFLLSGFGNMASLLRISQNTGKIKLDWFLKRLVRLLVSFIFSFAFVVVLTKLFDVCKFDYKSLGFHFIQLKLPDCSTWYLKIQILLYVLIFASYLLSNLVHFKNQKSIIVLTLYFLAIFVFCYDVIAYHFMKLPDYWWKTSFCFVIGALVYYKKSIFEMKCKKFFKCMLFFSFLLLFFCSYILSLTTSFSLLTLLLFSGISFGFCYLLDLFNVTSNILTKIGSISLELYLIHIGLMNIIETEVFSFLGDRMFSINVLVFILLSIGFAVMTNFLSGKVVSRIEFKHRNSLSDK